MLAEIKWGKLSPGPLKIIRRGPVRMSAYCHCCRLCSLKGENTWQKANFRLWAWRRYFWYFVKSCWFRNAICLLFSFCICSRHPELLLARWGNMNFTGLHYKWATTRAPRYSVPLQGVQRNILKPSFIWNWSLPSSKEYYSSSSSSVAFTRQVNCVNTNI